MTLPEAFEIIKASDSKATMEYNEPEGRGYSNVKMPGDMPYTKLPYGRITAINMDRGETIWTGGGWRWSTQQPAAQKS